MSLSKPSKPEMTMTDYPTAPAETSETLAVTLRDYQQDGVDVIREAFREHKRLCYVLPTGGGKTVIFSFITYHAMRKGSRTLILAHRVEIVEQISLALSRLGVPHGLILAGGKTTTDRIQVGMVQTVANRLDRLIAPSLLVLDEAHHAVAGTWKKLLDKWADAYVLGVTATPERLDGRGLRDVGFERLILGPDVRELIDMGHLAKFRYLGAAINVSFDDVATIGGDYDMHEVAARLGSNAVTGDIIAHYQKYLAGRTCIAFCPTVGHAERVAASYRQAGIPAASIDGAMAPAERRQVIEDLRRERIKVLTSCQVISEGFDAPEVGGAQLLRPTQSFAMFRQQIGRCLRPKQDGSEAIILDHVQNYARHGLPDEPREWDLDSKKRSAAERKKVKPMRLCRACGEVFAVHAKGAPCESEPGCIWAPRLLAQRPGTLGEIRRPPLAPAIAWTGGVSLRDGRYRLLILRAQGRQDRLEQIAQARGYKAGWVYHQMNEHRAGTGPIWGGFYSRDKDVS